MRATLVGLTVMGVACCVIVPAAPQAHAADDTLTILAQDFNLPLGGTFSATVGLPTGIDDSTLGADATITVTSHPLLEHRETFLAALDGSVGDSDDEFEISLDPADADPNLTRPSADSLGLIVPTATTRLSTKVVDRDETDQPDEPPTTEPVVDPVIPEITVVGQSPLQFYDPGVHAVEIELSVENRRVARAITFVNIVDPDESFGDMPISLVMGQTVQPTVAVDGSVTVTPDDTDELGRLADTLAAIDAVPAAAGLGDAPLPRGVFVEPATLRAITTSDPDLAARLTPGLVASEIIAAPLLPYEPSAAAAAGQVDRYTQLLSDGVDLLSQLLPGTTISRDVQLVQQPFTTDAADLQRQAGARLMVMDFDFYNTADGGNGMLTDTSQLVSIALPDDKSLPTAIIDPHLAVRMDNGGADPMLSSVQMVADLLVIAQSIHDDGGVVSRHGMTLARSDLGIPDAVLTSDLLTLLATTDGLRLVDPNDMVSTVDALQQPDGSDDLSITLPSQPTADLDGRVDLIEEISAEILSYASMLPKKDPQIDEWLQVLTALPSTVVGDDQADTMVDAIRSDFTTYTSGIHGPSPFTFTLTGRSNTVTFSLSNSTTTDLQVRIRLSSPKLTFPDGDVTVTLPAGGETEVNVRAEALSNGKSSVFLRVYAPAENGDVQLIPETVLTARVSSLAGLGQLLTGAGLLLLLTWWGRHWQQARRKRIAAGNVGRHPANGNGANGNGANGNGANGNGAGDGPASDGSAPDDLAPDAAASSLPPS